jgi:hypothetical protein
MLSDLRNPRPPSLTDNSSVPMTFHLPGCFVPRSPRQGPHTGHARSACPSDRRKPGGNAVHRVTNFTHFEVNSKLRLSSIC